MGFELHNKKYNSKIKIYYQDESYFTLAEEIINYIWLNNSQMRGFKLIKDDMKGRVYKYNHKGTDYYLKSYSHQRIQKIIKNFFRPAEGVRHFLTTRRLIARNIPVVKPVLGITLKQSLFKTDSIFVIREFKGINLYEQLQIIGNDQKLRYEIIKEIARVFAYLINYNFLNQDPSLFNILINYTGQQNRDFKLSLIDVDNIYLFPLMPKKIVVEHLGKFSARVLADMYKGNIKSLSSRERILFLAEFSKYYKKSFDLTELLNIVEKDTVRRLHSAGYKELINRDVF